MKKLLLPALFTIILFSGCLNDNSSNDPCSDFDQPSQRDFLEENAQKEDITVTDSGLQYRIIEEGSGARPNAQSDVIVNYVGSLTDGTIFDSGSSVRFPVGGVIPGFGEGVRLMNVGSTYELFLPAPLAYGDFPPPNSDICPGQVLIFEVELLDVRQGQ